MNRIEPRRIDSQETTTVMLWTELWTDREKHPRGAALHPQAAARRICSSPRRWKASVVDAIGRPFRGTYLHLHFPHQRTAGHPALAGTQGPIHPYPHSHHPHQPRVEVSSLRREEKVCGVLLNLRQGWRMPRATKLPQEHSRRSQPSCRHLLLWETQGAHDCGNGEDTPGMVCQKRKELFAYFPPSCRGPSPGSPGDIPHG